MSKIKRILRFVHGVIGLAVGLVILTIAISGCIYSYQKELRNILYPELISITPPHLGDRLPLDSLSRIATKHITSAKIREIVVHTDKNKSTKVYMYGNQLVYIHPFSGQVLGVKNTKEDPFLMAWSIHTRLGLGDIGKQIVAWSTFLCIPLILTGIWLWWPNRISNIKKSLALPLNQNWKKVNFQWHKNGGFYSSFLLLLICLTGVFMSFKWFQDGIYWITGSPQNQKIPPITSSFDVYHTNHLENGLDYILNNFPDVKETSIFFPSSKDKPFKYFAKYEDKLGRREIFYFNPYNSQLIHSTLYDDSSSGDKVKAINYNIHSGQIGGIIGKTIVFLITLFTAYLSISGIVLWIQRNAKIKNK